ncbi:MAG: DUF4091 domain-containing protein [Ruminococcaceae bacterium]|nr:DUF4091 domain-containing protein [Oscillospiraceae bacterium]
MLKTKLVSSQIKAFLDDNIDSFASLKTISALGGERLSFCLLYVDEGEPYLPVRPFAELKLEGELVQHTAVRDVRMVPVDRPGVPGMFDDQYLRTQPGLYPDLLTPLRYGGKVVISREKLRSLWLEVEIPKSFSGTSTLSITITEPETKATVTQSVEISVIAADLPEQKLLFTQWFYADCLASYYNVPVWSEEHWRIVENFAANNAKRGRNVLYTPLFTPALNVLPGWYRNPAQLVDVTVTDGEYAYDFAKVDRWVDMCDRIGIQYLEISHFYQQDQAKHAAHIYATVDGEYKRLFGWETLALDAEYQRFLRGLIGAFVDHMKARGDDHRCIYHMSDEPHLDNLEHYKRVKTAVADLLEGYKIVDALSNFEFYQEGALAHPVPTLASAPAFIEAQVPDLWVYYACCQLVEYTNCYAAMPSWRTRSLGMQLYKYPNITGFLHWGYNYYNNRASGDAINPFIDLGGEDWVPAGDTFMVYPDSDGTPLESIRLMTLEEAMQDVRAMQLCEQYYSHKEVVAAMEAVLGEPITFKRCAHSEGEMLKVREVINEMIRKAVEK